MCMLFIAQDYHNDARIANLSEFDCIRSGLGCKGSVLMSGLLIEKGIESLKYRLQ